MIVPYGADDDAAATLAFAKRQEAGFISEAAMRAMQAIIAKTDFVEYPENGRVERDVYTARGAMHYARALYVEYIAYLQSKVDAQ